MADISQLVIAYLHSMTFPCNEANAFDAVWTSSAMSEIADVTFIMKSLKFSKADFLKYYYIPQSNLSLKSIRPGWIPDRVFYRWRTYFPDLVASFLRISPSWAFDQRLKVMYFRDPALLRYFGLLRQHAAWLKDWILVYESHDPLGHDPNNFGDAQPFSNDPDIIFAATQMDLMITNSGVLAEDLCKWTDGKICPEVVSLASPLTRPDKPPFKGFGDSVLLGYIGTIDTFRGVDNLVKSLLILPDNFEVKLVGKFRVEEGVDSSWLQSLSIMPGIAGRLHLNITDHIQDVAKEIDECDIVVQTASPNLGDSRYATPQKAYGYMVRGKPILAADVPGHRDLFLDGKNALCFQLNPQDLAEKAIFLWNNPEFAERIARGAWETSEAYSYTRRAKEILGLINNRSKFG